MSSFELDASVLQVKICTYISNCEVTMSMNEGGKKEKMGEKEQIRFGIYR
jgi:hypothetical protein